MDIVRLIDEKVLSVVEKMYGFLGGEVDYQGFEIALKKELDELGCQILKSALEGADCGLRESKERKKEWNLVRKNDLKTLLSPFGQFEYQRSYYRHKLDKSYSYLVDVQAGIKSHSRVSENLKAELIDAASVMSYEGATKEISRFNATLKMSRQTVASSVQNFSVQKDEPPQEKRKVRFLYIEADEDHVKVKGHKRTETRLIYVHEGVAEKPRRHLVNARYFATTKKSPDQHWYEVGEHIAMHYDLEAIEQIFLCGDGASWIKVGLEYIVGAIFVLDKFHLNKYIKEATGHIKEVAGQIRRGIWTLNQEAALNGLRKAYRSADTKARKERIANTAKYIKNNWDGIVAQVMHPEVGCSAEGHISHILAARMSTRPMAWSLTGADNMSQMRTVRANGRSVKVAYLAGIEPAPLITGLKEVAQKELKNLRKRKSLGLESINNVPILNGTNSFTTMALKSINKRIAI